MSESNQFHSVDSAVSWLKQGRLLAYPTESVWGIGCDAMNEQAVQQVLSIKNRPIDKGMIVVVDTIDRLSPFLTGLSHQQQQTLISSWQSAEQQQATTWLLPIPKNITVPDWITGKHDSVAIRVIAHPLIQQLCKHLVSQDNPFGLLVSTSCNPAGMTPASTIEEARSYFAKSDSVGYLSGTTLGYTLPSQIKNALTGEIIR